MVLAVEDLMYLTRRNIKEFELDLSKKAITDIQGFAKLICAEAANLRSSTGELARAEAVTEHIRNVVPLIDKALEDLMTLTRARRLDQNQRAQAETTIELIKNLKGSIDMALADLMHYTPECTVEDFANLELERKHFQLLQKLFKCGNRTWETVALIVHGSSKLIILSRRMGIQDIATQTSNIRKKSVFCIFFNQDKRTVEASLADNICPNILFYFPHSYQSKGRKRFDDILSEVNEELRRSIQSKTAPIREQARLKHNPDAPVHPFNC
jgi:hypothetical protein